MTKKLSRVRGPLARGGSNLAQALAGSQKHSGVVDNPEVEYFLKTIYPVAITIVDPDETWQIIGADGVDTNQGTQAPCAYAYRQIDPVSGDYTFRFKFHKTSNTAAGHLFWVGLSEAPNCWQQGALASLDMNYVRSNQANLAVGGMVDGVNDISGNLGINADTDYWCELKRVGAQMQLRVYSDPDFTTQVGSTISNTLSSIDIMNYIMIAINYGVAGANVVDILTEEISFTE